MRIFQKRKKVNIHLFPSGRFGNQMFLAASTLRLIALLEAEQKKYSIIYHITDYADLNQGLVIPIKIDKYFIHKFYLFLFSNKSIYN